MGGLGSIQCSCQANFTISIERRWSVVPGLGSEDDDRERSSVFQCVCQVLCPCVLPRGTRATDTEVFYQTLSEPNDAGDGNDKGKDEVLSTVSIGLRGARESLREKHAERHVQIPQDFGVAGQGIGQENIPELAMLRIC